jgi:hypothetical protein
LIIHDEVWKFTHQFSQRNGNVNECFINAIAELPDGRVLAAGNYNLHLFTPETDSTYTTRSFYDPYFYYFTATEPDPLKRNIYWVTSTSGLHRVDLQEDIITFFPFPNKVNYCYFVQHVNNDLMLIALDNDVVTFDKKKQKFSDVSALESGAQVLSCFIDNKGMAYLGTDVSWVADV